MNEQICPDCKHSRKAFYDESTKLCTFPVTTGPNTIEICQHECSLAEAEQKVSAETTRNATPTTHTGDENVAQWKTPLTTHPVSAEAAGVKVDPAANVAWLKANEEKYRGQWVALKNGKFLGAAASMTSLMAHVDYKKGSGILLTSIYAPDTQTSAAGEGVPPPQRIFVSQGWAAAPQLLDGGFWRYEGGPDDIEYACVSPVDEASVRRVAEKIYHAMFNLGGLTTDRVIDGIAAIVRELSVHQPVQAAARLGVLPERLHNALHLLWTKAVGQDGYIKAEWRELDDAIFAALAASPVQRNSNEVETK